MAERVADGASDALDIEVVGDGEQVTVVLRGELDVVTSPELRETMLRLVEEGARTIDIDIAGVALIDSTGLGVLVGVLKRVLQHGGAMTLRSPGSSARRVLEITGLDRVFTIVD